LILIVDELYELTTDEMAIEEDEHAALKMLSAASVI
jgi:hypothetical protein